jgi:hypothetical protein
MLFASTWRLAYPEPADQYPSPPHEVARGKRLLAVLGMNPLAGAALALLQLRREPQLARLAYNTRLGVVFKQLGSGPAMEAGGSLRN